MAIPRPAPLPPAGGSQWERAARVARGGAGRAAEAAAEAAAGAGAAGPGRAEQSRAGGECGIRGPGDPGSASGSRGKSAGSGDPAAGSGIAPASPCSGLALSRSPGGSGQARPQRSLTGPRPCRGVLPALRSPPGLCPALSGAPWAGAASSAAPAPPNNGRFVEGLKNLVRAVGTWGRLAETPAGLRGRLGGGEAVWEGLFHMGRFIPYGKVYSIWKVSWPLFGFSGS